MATKKKMLQAAAGSAAGGEALDITDVFSTYLYEGNGTPQTNRNTISNGIDLAGEGGMVWIKSRTDGISHRIYDTERGVHKGLATDSTAAQNNDAYTFTSFNSDGFEVWFDQWVNKGGSDFASWTFRKAPKFFDVVTYTGDGTSSRAISHNLGTTVGTILIKETNAASNWLVFHRSLANTDALQLNTTAAKFTGQTVWGSTSPTDTQFYVGGGGNNSGKNFVAYLFAHNDGDGGFGPDGDQDIIKCGSYTGNGADQEIDIGFEPQWILTKPSTFAHDWYIWDTMRGFKTYSGTDTNNLNLKPNEANAESDFDGIALTSTGFSLHGASNAANSSGQTYIYMAIRRGPLAQPESGTEVFAIDGFTARTSGSWFRSGFPVDFALRARPNNADEKNALSRLTGDKMLRTDSTGAEVTTGNAQWDWMDGYGDAVANSSFFSWMWKRAPGFFDAVAYTGDGVAGRTVPHNLGVAPEMGIFKVRNNGQYNWNVYLASLGVDINLTLNSNNASSGGFGGLLFNSTAPTSSEITLGNWAAINAAGNTYIAYLFATVPGVSKVGSYTGSDGTQTIDCGFTSGARFILIKRSSGSGDWNVWDTTRGINAGSDPFITLNTTDAESSGQDEIDAHASGFIINSPGGAGDAEINKSGSTYIFYAIA